MKRIGLHHWVIVLTIAIAAHAALLVRFTLNDTIRTADTGAAGLEERRRRTKKVIRRRK